MPCENSQKYYAVTQFYKCCYAKRERRRCMFMQL